MWSLSFLWDVSGGGKGVKKNTHTKEELMICIYIYLCIYVYNSNWYDCIYIMSYMIWPWCIRELSSRTLTRDGVLGLLMLQKSGEPVEKDFCCVLQWVFIYLTYVSRVTLPETKVAPENGWLEYYFPIGEAYIFRGYVSFREGISVKSTTMCSLFYLSAKKERSFIWN